MPYAKFKGLFTQLIGVPYRPSEDSARPVSVGCDYNPCPFFRSLDTSRCAHHLIAGPSTVASRPIQHKDIGAPVKKKEKRPRLILKLEKASEFREPLLSPRPFPKTNPFVFSDRQVLIKHQPIRSTVSHANSFALNPDNENPAKRPGICGHRFCPNRGKPAGPACDNSRPLSTINK